MKTIFLLLMLCMFAASSPAQTPTNPAPPPCFVVSGAAGYTMGASDAGRYAAWHCPNGWGDWSMVLLVMRTGYLLKHPTLPPGASPAETAAAYWRANVAVDCWTGPIDADLLALCDRAFDAGRASRPPPPFVVRPNGTATTRPTYAVVNGVRAIAPNGTVPIRDANGRPVPCNPAQKLGAYMQVKRTPNLVALCSPS